MNQSLSRRRKTSRSVLAFTCVLLATLAGIVWVHSDAHSAPVTCALSSGSHKVAASPGASILAASDADLNRELSLAEDLDMWAVRIDVDWSVVEPRRGQRNWAPIDRVVNAVVAHGMCPVGLATYTPLWAARPLDFPRNSHYRPADPNLFASFAAAAAQRYSQSIAVWEIWNEPNLANYWLPRSNTTEYGQLLAASYTAIKRAVPEAAVISGGLAPGTDNGRDIAPLTFVRNLYQGGFNRSLDALSVHPYTYPALPNDPAAASWSTAARMWDMRDVMVAAGDGDKKIWMTEFGAPTGSGTNAVSEEIQAQSIQIAIGAQNDAPWLGPLFIYSLRDAGTDPNNLEHNFGLVRRDWSPKQAYTFLDSR
ncbi:MULTISPECIES: cellulase family glycosylhydrolase [Gordonia]|uniref:Cellulase family glycosylhydrolase n=1 Tax=Gordonia amicalis TaxID=89053 RepID=A0AAE4R114_9ACTN|nr:MULTISPECIES: cellulase family glycosylhydrolase [Gordonia]ATD71940.1 beta-xylosidase [Gordonia sp. 1D]MCR8896191.1 cellulase family glycosylhydrolase [Gordonia sp. GONU]MCZ4650735.1 cellulase family glycosylhydrolase [Gordonia amicalis]MDJ0451665.1 cellulase family glycosylhydrolase [Gordonia amicalis]MDV6306515.1 cellulase family glycosylhydrolase [Gordonia amicalis]